MAQTEDNTRGLSPLPGEALPHGSDYLTNRRRKNFCPKELNIIISAVEENTDLIYNRVNCNTVHSSKHDFWVGVTNLINETCHLVTKRDVKEVRRKWVTLQSEVKSKAKEGVHLLNNNDTRVYKLIQANQTSDGLSMIKMMSVENAEINGLQNFDHGTVPGNSMATNNTMMANTIKTTPNLSPQSVPSPPVIKTETINEAELLVSICSQVIGELSASKPLASQAVSPTVQRTQDYTQPISSVPQLPSSSLVVPASLPSSSHLASLPSITLTSNIMPVTSYKAPQTIPPPQIARSTTSLHSPGRNVVSVQPQSSNYTPKRARTDPAPADVTQNILTNTEQQTQISQYLEQLIALQREANQIQAQRLVIETQRRDLEKEKFEMEKARYEIEKERLCQEIISRKK